VESLLEEARARGIQAEHVEVQTFDAFMLRLWRNLADKPPELDAKVRRTDVAQASIALPGPGTAKPIVRVNALPVLSLPARCQRISFSTPKEWSDLHEARNATGGQLILTKSDSVCGWGTEGLIREAFGNDVRSIDPYDLPVHLDAPDNLHFKGLIEEAISTALARGKPLLCRATRTQTYLICDPDGQDKSALQPLSAIVGATSGVVPGLFTGATEEHPRSVQVRWSEALRVHLDIKDGRHWLLIDPDLWIWPQRSRRDATAFLDERRGDRYNKKYNALLDAWIRIVLGTDQRNTEIDFPAFDEGNDTENPVFRIASRTAYTRRLAQ
jgi:hypothetical protein